MAGLGIRLDSDFGEVDRELDRLQRLPDARMVHLLNMVLDMAYVATQADVHVRTGSLKSSGKMSDNRDLETDSWEGELTYGGPSEGPNNPVDYAIYEKARGGSHDFMASTEGLDPLFVAAIKAGLSPEH
jgi:hypothetical protein